MDSSKNYVLNCIQALLGLDKQPQGLANSQVLDNLLYRPEKKSLTLQYQPGKGLKVYNPNAGEVMTEDVRIVSISKIGIDVVPDENFQKYLSIQLVSGSNSLADLLAHVNNLYLPLLSGRVDEALKKTLQNLKYQLDMQNSGSIDGQQDEDDISRIMRPSDEFEYWIRVATMSNASDAEQKRAGAINQIFFKVSKAWKESKQLDLNAFKDLLDQTLDVIDEIWTSSLQFPEKRFVNLLLVLQGQITNKLESTFPSGSNIFVGSAPNTVKLRLAEAQKLVKSFLDGIKQYLDYDWKGGSKPLREDVDLSELNECLRRINEIVDLRNILEEIMKVHGVKVDIEEIFREVTEINPFVGVAKSQSTQAQVWLTASKKVQINLEQVEQDLVRFLRNEVFNQQLIKENPLQTIRDMQRWQGLLGIHSIQKQFQGDREQIILSMMSMIERLREEFNNRSGAALMDADLNEDQLPYSVNFSKTLHQIIWSKSIMGKVKKILTMAQQLFSDLKKAQSLFQACTQIVQSTQQFEQEQFDGWRQEIGQILKTPDNELALQISGKLMEIDLNDGILRVNYSEKLVHLIKEVRQLCELGFRKQIPKQIIEITEVGKKYYKEALTLKQVANFYNQMSDQIVDCQKPMLVDQAIAFENIIKNMKMQQKNKKAGQAGQITWDNADELESYIARIQDAANAIMSENRRLRKLHNSILEVVLQLFEIDLVKQKNVWKDKMDQIRRMIETGCSGKDVKLCRSWRVHWDYQVFKALECQYQRGFQTLEQNITEINADVILKGAAIQFKPPVEELREKYYHEIRNFIAYPSTSFQGVGGYPDLYKMMPEKNADYLNVVYERAESLFCKLDQVTQQYNQWAVVGTLDPESMQSMLPNLEAWADFMKEVRVRRKDLERIQDQQKIDCFTLNLGPFKQQVDAALTKLIEGMMAELKNQIKLDCEDIEAFLVMAQEKLSKRPTSMAEMSEAQLVYMELKALKFDMSKRLTESSSKSKLVMSLSTSATSQQALQSVQKHWENFELLIGDFDSILSEQTKTIKLDMKVRAKDIEAEVDKFYSRYQALKPKQVTELDKEAALDMAEQMRAWRQQWKDIEEKVNLIQRDHDHFELVRPEFGQLVAIQTELSQQEVVWDIFDNFQLKVDLLGKEDWLSYRTKVYTFQELLSAQLDSLKMQLSQEKVSPRDPVIVYLQQQIDVYFKIYPLLKLLVGEGFEQEHWTSLFQLLKLKDMKRDKLLFQNLLDCDRLLLQKSLDIKELQARAQGEVTLREAILELRTWCETSEFELTEYTNNNRVTPLIKEWKDLMTKVSDNQSLLSSLKESKFISRFSEQVEQFESKLGGIDEYLSKLNIIQRKWVYLEPIFLRGALPSEQGRFKRLDDDYRTIMLGIQRDSKVVCLCSIPGIKDTLETVLDQLERCQKALNDFLEDKRGKFPRFYFLGDDDLLEILGQSQNPLVIQMHLKKLFAGINSVEFNTEATQIYSMLSSAKEQVKLNDSIVVNEVVESWLCILSDQMQNTLKDSLKACLKEKQMEFGRYPSQILCVCEEIKFTEQAVSAIRSGKLTQCKADSVKLLESFTQLNGQSAGNLLVQLKLKALILDLIHHIDVIDQGIHNNVTQVTDWDWYKQLRFEFNVSQGIAQIVMCKARFDYTYEYQGNAPKLVHTPLTDKCYLTLTQGMSMGYGGNPYGPAGTGKTESVKALGQLFGRQVLVFNCDEGIDFKSMGRIFIGLVKCGAWGCFDEFNRLLEEQLSAISQQIQIIQHAIKEGSASMLLLGSTVLVNKDSGIFVTLNPAGKNYGGRSKLPDNLKQLFRPVAMSVPDNELIAEVLLYSEGFKAAKELAEKVITIFTLSRQLLSPQQHYDWGLRALKTILTVAGQIMQEERKVSQVISAEQEAELLIKAIRINTMSKLTFADTKKFASLVMDVFPGIKSQDIAYEKLTESVKEVLGQMKLSVIDNQLAKILQFYEATKQRMGVVLVGPSGCGKTTIWKVLKRAHERMGRVVKTYIMNPKSMPRSQLLGNMNNDTREFSEGVLTASARQVVKEANEVLNWIICDGDIDPEWIESLNSVLDDNHLLTLPTGERISFGDNVNFIFETSDLQYASPATVSRMGMIFLNNEDISIESLINRWVSKLECTEEHQRRMSDWIESYFYAGLQYTTQVEDKQVVSTTRIGLVLNVLSQLSRLPQSKQQFNYFMLLGLASNFTNDTRSEIAANLFQTLGETPPIDLSRTPLDFTFDQAYHKYTHVPTQLDDSQFTDLDQPPVVMTVGHQRDLQMIKGWVDNGDPFIIVGHEGMGKNLLIQSAFHRLKQTIKIQIATIHCNAQTSASQIIQKLNQVCSKGTSALGRVLKPKECSRLVLYLKDINLPKPDKYQTIQLIAFLQQLITHRGFYDDNLEFVYLDDKIQIVASMNPPSTVGRHPLSTRFTANVRIHYIDPPTPQEMQLIYSEYLRAAIYSSQKLGSTLNNQQAQEQAQKLSQLLVDCYSTICSKFSVDEHRHYQFTPRNITHIIFGMMRYLNLFASPETILEALLNELNKNFRDRLVSLEEQSKFDNLVMGLIKSIFKSTVSGTAYFGTAVNLLQLSRLDKKDFKSLIKLGIQRYSREHRELDLYLVDETLSLMASLNRALSSQSATSILLAGRSGIGRKCCVSVMSNMLNQDMLIPYTARDYGIREFKKDLKVYMELAGVQNKACVLYLEDHVLLQSSSIIEIVNSLIASGEVAGLFAHDEVDRMFQHPEEIRAEYYGRTLYEAFLERCKKNMKVVLSMDYTNKQFAHNCAANPALFTKCTLIWLPALTKDSMQFYLNEELKDNILKDVPAKEKEEFFNQAIGMHKFGIENGASPRSFLALLSTYKDIFNKKNLSRGSQSKHLHIGLKKLVEAKELVDTLTSEAQEKKKLLAVKQQQADQALQQISGAMQDAAERKTETEQLQRFLQEEEGKIQGSKQKVEGELAGVKPIVDEAKKAVNGINKSNLDELRGLKMPPEAIHNVLSAVMKVFKQSDTRWTNVQIFLKQRGVIEQIVDFDPHMITPDIRKDVEDQINKYPNSFEKAVIYRASLAAGPLAEWVLAILKYATVLEKIAPLEGELNKLYKKLESSRLRLKQCQDQLANLDNKVQQLKEDFGGKTQEAEILKFDLKKAEETVGLAKNLLDKLADEQTRWQQQYDTISQEVRQFPIDSLLSAAYTVYLSHTDENIRLYCIQEWRKLCKTEKYDYVKFMSTESQLLKWKAQGLPGDQLSIENSIMIFNSSKTPLLIDPNTQASEWLKANLQQSGGVECLSQLDAKFSNQLELSVRFGKVLLIQELDSIEGLLAPLLRKDLVHQGPRWVVMIGDKAVDYNENFKLYLSTRNSAIDLPPHSEALAQVVNFTVTRSGLESKLLSIIINIEQPELEQKKQKLLENEESLKVQLSDLERTLLEELANSTGNILENRLLIDSLNQTKSKSTIISKSLQQSSELQSSLDQQREVYRPLAHKGAGLFILISDLQKVNNMYRYSLAYFVKIFKRSLDIQVAFDSTQQKLEHAAIQLFKNIFNQVASSLFKVDRLMFGLHIVKGIKPELFEVNEWDYFLGNQVHQEGKHALPKWAQQDRKDAFNGYMQAFPKQAQQINFNDKDWDSWTNNAECEKNFPQQYTQKLSSFQKVLLVYVFRPERIQSALSNFVCESLMITSVSGQSFSFKGITQGEISQEVPCLFVVSAGSDPSTELLEFADQEVGRENFQELSMGGNQNDLALQMLKEAAAKGQWLCLKNLHLVISFLPILEKTFKSLDANPNFRLWFTTEAHTKFPSILLETCFKVSYESPPGLKKNLVRLVQQWPNNYLQSGNNIRAQLLFILAWFHALVQERRTYIPQGWSKFYEFSYGDQRAGAEAIENLIQEQGNQPIQWQSLYGLYENAIYGGRIDNEQDLRVLRAYLQTYFNDNMLKGGQLPSGAKLPQSNQAKEYANIVNKLPEQDNPQLFGLPLNIDKAVQRYAIQGVLSGLKSMSSIVGEEMRFDKERWTQILNPLINLWTQLTRQVKENNTNQKLPTTDDPVDSFVFLEFQQSDQQFQKIEQLFDSLKSVLFSNGLLTTEIIEIGLVFIKDQVPPKWSNLWEGPDSVTAWLKAFCKKIIALKKWIEKIQNKSLFQEPLTLSELFHPEIFMNALRQKTARKLAAPLNTLKLMVDFDAQKLKSPFVVKLSGLLLQGCGFQDNTMIDPPANLQEFTSLPNLAICFVPKSQQDNHPVDQLAEFPIFLNAQREKMLCRVSLLNQGSVNERVIAGVAIFLSQVD